MLTLLTVKCTAMKRPPHLKVTWDSMHENRGVFINNKLGEIQYHMTNS